ncbi:NAD(P)-dependent oxidoreductase [Cryobacterium tepidiphilum]|uniref:D-2-hydroxyacid dehydrogenase family protein n=1 Tax=Cryobacterium tepidiphilum TaxID=2486026 RepID=A0A3M8L1N2_9MICO|nr:NAD(P)-dependent oxidoreductase [Cryobacterium tepidiphilum]RNE59276.1 D-2-hydroxyacid dehydrogenase family protein [Cryobacterium tepidiphilum]
MSRLQVVVLDDREGLIGRSPGMTRMRKLADVRVLTGSLDQLTDDQLSTVQVLMPMRERTKLDAATLARMPSLELVLQTGGHAYHLDADYTAEHGIPVALGRRAYGPKAAIPELTFALAIDALRMIPQADQSMRGGEWKPFLGRTLSGRTLGILGYGRHGVNVARIAKAFGMKVLAWQRTPGQEGTADVQRVGLDELLAESDVLSIHLKLTDESRGLLDAEKLARMKPGSVLVNTARGAIVDEEALIEALKSGPMSAAALDVFAHEPLAEDSPLRSLPNVVLTPHIGWTVEEVLTEFADIAADQLGAYLDGRLDRKELQDGGVTLAAAAHGGLTDDGA